MNLNVKDKVYCLNSDRKVVSVCYVDYIFATTEGRQSSWVICKEMDQGQMWDNKNLMKIEDFPEDGENIATKVKMVLHGFRKRR